MAGKQICCLVGTSLGTHHLGAIVLAGNHLDLQNWFLNGMYRTGARLLKSNGLIRLGYMMRTRLLTPAGT